MGYVWKSCPSKIKDFIFNLNKGIKEMINESYVGFYLHGSLAMGGFNTNSSDIDVLVITDKSMEIEDKRNLAQFLLDYSKSPFSIEISFLNTEQLRHWQHPCPYDFHYSELWRGRFETDLLNGTYQFLNDDIHLDGDLAAHLTITYQRGICVEGKPIKEVFPLVPRSDYISSILGDYQDCLVNIEEDPIYCSLNLLRVFWYLKEGVISSKQEAGDWGLKTFPRELSNTIHKVVDSYANGKGPHTFEKEELIQLRDYISNHVQKLLS
ncbi:aminoglycoside adenylyltransferase domain-containing protein [Bacillus timonensis]|uniref:aminoglycoside adenylyltransferase domain-containing protein n=1 Tax=Bacillus timonensis TaxID=1033734 RepID=UPI000289FC94|nr:aminoglycoside adenylyltransferase domain-containing protein [Bacillus timonensis]